MSDTGLVALSWWPGRRVSARQKRLPRAERRLTRTPVGSPCRRAQIVVFQHARDGCWNTRILADLGERSLTRPPGPVALSWCPNRRASERQTRLLEHPPRAFFGKP
jgi:hypothetical protein